jgi:AcrR family transcriptional regulator
MAKAVKDRRIERTREALQGAFVQLMFEGRRYDRITIADLIARAGVGRSTFYEHYRNKDEILAETIRYPFAQLAAAVDLHSSAAMLREVLVHFQENVAHAKVIFGGAARRKVARVLASMIEERLRARAQVNGVAPDVSLGIAAVAIADGQLAAIMAWLGGEVAGDVGGLATVLHRVAQAAAVELCDR